MPDPFDADLPVALIDESPDQAREKLDPEALGRLADNIAANGLAQRVGVKGPSPEGRYQLGWGHRRWLAHKLLNRVMIPARVYPWKTDMLDLAAAENLEREQLNPVEEARLVERFRERGMSRVEIARRCRRSESWVDQRSALLSLPADVLDGIRDHGLTLAVANLLADVDHEPYRRQLVYEAVTHGATAATAAVWRQHFLADRDRIIRNDVAIEQVIAERERYILKYPCDWCDEEVPYQGTRTVRLCVECAQQLTAAKAGAV